MEHNDEELIAAGALALGGVVGFVAAWRWKRRQIQELQSEVKYRAAVLNELVNFMDATAKTPQNADELAIEHKEKIEFINAMYLNKML